MKLPGRGLLLVFCGVWLAPPASAYFVKPQLKETLGSGAYYGTYGSVDAGNDLHFRPAFSSYHSATSSGTYKTYSLDAVYDIKDFSLDLNGGFSPTVNDYNNYFVGGKVSRFYQFGKKAFFKRLTLSAGVLQTIHGEQVFKPAVNAGTQSIPASTSTVHIQQTDAQGYVAVTIPDATVSLSLTKSIYDIDIARLSVRAAKVTRLAGLNQTVQGFPDVNAALKAELDVWDRVTPYAMYSYTSFKAQQPIAQAYTLGSYLTWPWIEFDASYQRFSQKGAADINYYSLGATVRFE